MSINVNVTGNPIKINKGKYVGGDDYSSREFDRRRKLRLEQVRQQSKDIAENVRKRVQKEKEKQLSEFEKKSEKELKKWQTKKLLTLQQQYQECVKEIGSGHTLAMLEPNAEDMLNMRKKQNENIANERGIIAGQEEQIRKNESNYKRALPIQQKKFSRIIEDTRSKLVSSVNKSKSKYPKEANSLNKEQKITTNIDISRTLIESEVESSTSDLGHVGFNSSESSEESSAKKICREKADEKCQNPYYDNHSERIFENDKGSNANIYNSSKNGNVKENMKPSKLHTELSISSNDSPRNSNLFLNYPMETRISERIKSRPKPPDPIFPLSNCRSQELQCPSKIDVGIDSPSYVKLGASQEKYDTNNQVKETKTTGSQTSFSENKMNKKEIIIPAKPTISLTGLMTAESSKKSSKTTQGVESQLHTGSSKVFYYDHTNRFSRYSSNTEQPIMGKINEDDIVILDNDESCKLQEHQQLSNKRDKEAILRGQRALEKDKVHRDYRNMLNSLSSLQKQERIATIAEHPQKYHMSEDRLREKYRQEQNKMENAYEQTIEQKRRIVTLKPIHQEPYLDTNVLPFDIKTPSAKDKKSVSTNLANWDVNYKNMAGESTLQREDLRTKSLLDMLERVNLQRMLLEKEMTSSLKADGNFFQHIGIADSEKEITTKIQRKCPCTIDHEKSKRKATLSSSELDTSNSDASAENIALKSKNMKAKEKTSRKIIQNHKKVKKTNEHILKTEGTQTSPSIKSTMNKEVQSSVTVDNVSAQTNSNKTNADEAPVLKKASVPRVVNAASDDNLCEIIIKIKDDKSEGTKIVVNSGVDVKTNEDLIKIHKSKPVREKTKQTKNITQNTESLSNTEENISSKKSIATEKRIKKGTDSTLKPIPKSKNNSTSWKDQLSKNSVSMSNTASSSTSYYSPPDPATLRNSRDIINHSKINGEKARGFLLNLLKNRPKQSNIDPYDSTVASTISSCHEKSSQKNTSVNIRSYIKTLLSMSRTSVDNLGVSTGSEISTPGTSVINTEENNPQLMNILRLLNINQTDLQYLMNISDTSSGSSNRHYVSVETLSSTSSCSINFKEKPTAVNRKSEENNIKEYQTSYASTSKENANTEKAKGDCNPLCGDYPVLVSKYTELADRCSQRISNLTTMIEKVRQEKLKLLQSSSSSNNSDKEHSTAYLDLPNAFTNPQGEVDDKNTKNVENKENQNTSTGLTDEEFLNKCLLEIDTSFAEKLKVESTLKKFLNQSKQPVPIIEQGTSNERIDNRDENNLQQKETSTENEENFVPFLKDIPKYSATENHQESNSNAEMFANLFPPNFLPARSKPPATIINSARKHNLNVDVVPHELSTIPEMDTAVGSRNVSMQNEMSRPNSLLSEAKGEKQVSFRNDAEMSDTTKTSSTDDAEHGHALQKSAKAKHIGEMIEKFAAQEKHKRAKDDEPDARASDAHQRATKTKFVSIVKKTVRPASSDSSERDGSNDVEMEAMLKSMGMGWAIATLRKTQEALALTSSSSSLDISMKQTSVKVSESSSSSESSLREILHKHLLDKFSTDGSINASLLLKELCNCSPLHSSSQDKTNQRTSTPIQGVSKSGGSADSQSQLALFPVDSDISSVKHNSDDMLFLTIPTDSDKSQDKSDV